MKGWGIFVTCIFKGQVHENDACVSVGNFLFRPMFTNIDFEEGEKKGYFCYIPVYCQGDQVLDVHENEGCVESV